MVLLAGDLFHENKPSRPSMYQTLALLREHCMSSRPISLEIVSDVGVGLQTGYESVPLVSMWSSEAGADDTNPLSSSFPFS